jgi:hypothetical protein
MARKAKPKTPKPRNVLYTRKTVSALSEAGATVFGDDVKRALEGVNALFAAKKPGVYLGNLNHDFDLINAALSKHGHTAFMPAQVAYIVKTAFGLLQRAETPDDVRELAGVRPSVIDAA